MEGKLVLRWTRLSRCAIRDNAVRLQLFAPAYNLGTFALRERLIKIGTRIVRHGRYLVFQLAEVAVRRALSPTSCGASTGDAACLCQRREAAGRCGG